MGQKSSTQKVQAEVTVPAGLPLVDALSMSCSTTRCWGRGKLRLARYTFPRQHWVSCQGRQVCRSKELQKLPFAKLGRLDASTDVKVKCILRGAPVFAASVPLARLLALGEEGAVGEDAALLLFSLAGGEGAAADRGAAYTVLSCSGRLCGSDGNAGEDGGQGDAERLSHWEGGCGAPASPGDHQLVERQQQHGLPPQSQDPATASLALGADDHLLDHPAEESVASEAIRSYKDMTPVELWCPAWRTPTCDMEARAKADALLPSASVPAFVPELRPVRIRLPDSDRIFTVPRVHMYCKDPPASAQDSDVPDGDLGESSTLAPHDDDPEPEPFVGHDSAAPETNLGEFPSLEFYEAGLEPESYGDVQPPSAQDREAAQAEDPWKPVPSPQEEESLGSGELWGRVILDHLAVVNMVGYCLMFLYTFWT